MRTAMTLVFLVALGAGCARPPVAPVAVASDAPAPPPGPAVATPPPAPPPPAAPRATATTPQPAPAKPAAPSAAKPQPAPRAAATPTLDFASLESRLRATKAIGVLTKLSLKNQIDDLLEAFKAYHQGQGPALTTLRERYDLLLLKVRSLLQDDDAALARDVASSRDAIWGILVDRARFRQLTATGGRVQIQVT